MFKFKVLPIHYCLLRDPSLGYIDANIVCSCGSSHKDSNGTIKGRGKHPITARGSLSATSEEHVIAEWKRRNPGCNWGIATGHDGLVVVDIDPRHGGHLAWVELISKHNGYPATLMVKTGSGGTHLYYRIPDGKAQLPNSAGRVGPGIDIRGRGGYVVAPPSNHESGGRYSWCEPRLEIAEMPKWLYELAKRAEYKPKTQIDKILDRVEFLFSGASEGERNIKAARIAGYYIRKVDEIEAWNRLCEWNTRNSPPLPDSELAQVFRSIRRYK